MHIMHPITKMYNDLGYFHKHSVRMFMYVYVCLHILGVEKNQS